MNGDLLFQVSNIALRTGTHIVQDGDCIPTGDEGIG